MVTEALVVNLGKAIQNDPFIMGLFTIHSFSWDMDNLSLQIKGKLHLIVLFKIIEKIDFSFLATK